MIGGRYPQQVFGDSWERLRGEEIRPQSSSCVLAEVKNKRKREHGMIFTVRHGMNTYKIVMFNVEIRDGRCEINENLKRNGNNR